MQTLGVSKECDGCSLSTMSVAPIFKSPSLNGFSVSDHCNYVFIPSLKICFNVGLNVEKSQEQLVSSSSSSSSSQSRERRIEFVCLNDTKSENIQGLLSLLEEQVHEREGKLKIFLPAGRMNYLRAICEGIYGSIEKSAQFVELIGVSDHFKSYPLWSNHPSLELKTFPVRDIVDTENIHCEIGYSIIEKKRKLKTEFLEQVKTLKAHEKKQFMQDDLKFSIEEFIHFSIVKQVLPNERVFECNREILRNSSILCIGCSQFQSYLGYNCDTLSQKENQPPSESTLNIESLNYHILNSFNGNVLILTHLPRSLCLYGECDMYCYLIPRIPPQQRNKLKLLTYRLKRHQVENCPYTLEQIRNIQKERKWVDYETEYLDMDQYEFRERGVYFGGGEQKRKKLDSLFKKYPQGFITAYKYKDKYISRSSAFSLYEDGYYEFLKNHPQLLDYICDTCCDIYDTEPSNIESGYDYEQQDSKEKGTHLQDVAVRRALKRLGREFKGTQLLQLRGYKSPLYFLNPCVIPFHERENIIQPEIIEEFMFKQSVESFWQSNKVILTKKESRDQ
ncbi:hypothetical protein FDP41_000829 [Naegleria fowleri]|uniref:Uncharacterized protein n=1 Tax=Naegleria fowleri TaxID=5763 RepID=A0A6A5CHE8_NAEFO|nr:uncharacterized protein FDP41_000829 [Naegleria fowleri]KAF0984930.1 hypothetical protein FDP41_000829 [Naegleria fowleri]CAG4718581.1 unnamed protein product [Naegleria fowleri]